MIRDPRVIVFDAIDAEHAYATTQTRDDIRNGDVLVVPGVAIGVMCGAWPVLVSGDADATGFERLTDDADVTTLGATRFGRTFGGIIGDLPIRGGSDYSASFALAQTLAAEHIGATIADDRPADDPDVANYTVLPFRSDNEDVKCWTVDAPTGRRIGVVLQACGRIFALTVGSCSPDPCESRAEAVALLVGLDRMVRA